MRSHTAARISPPALIESPQRNIAGAQGWQRLRQVPTQVLLSMLIFAVVIGCAVFAPVVAPHDPLEQDLLSRLRPPAWLARGNSEHWLGTDQLGRDLLSRVTFGAQISLLVAFTGGAIGGVLGCVLGALSGYLGGIVDDVIMTVVDIQLAFPFILLAISVMAVLGTSLLNLTIIVGISGWVPYARIIRSQILQLKEREFIIAAAAIGGTNARILLRHLLPNTVSVIIVLATLQVGRMILLEATLSFLGLGVQPPTPSWGGILNEGREFIATAWWIALFPGLSLLLTSLAANRFGDWLRDVLDPRLHSH